MPATVFIQEVKIRERTPTGEDEEE